MTKSLLTIGGALVLLVTAAACSQTTAEKATLPASPAVTDPASVATAAPGVAEGDYVIKYHSDGTCATLRINSVRNKYSWFNNQRGSCSGRATYTAGRVWLKNNRRTIRIDKAHIEVTKVTPEGFEGTFYLDYRNMVEPFTATKKPAG